MLIGYLVNWPKMLIIQVWMFGLLMMPPEDTTVPQCVQNKHSMLMSMKGAVSRTTTGFAACTCKAWIHSTAHIFIWINGDTSRWLFEHGGPFIMGIHIPENIFWNHYSFSRAFDYISWPSSKNRTWRTCEVSSCDLKHNNLITANIHLYLRAKSVLFS